MVASSLLLSHLVLAHTTLLYRLHHHHHNFPPPFSSSSFPQDKLIDASCVTHLYKLTDRIGCVMTGTIPDTLSAVRKAREFAAEFQFQHGYQIPVHFLAKKVADENQLYTQAAYKRSLASVMILGW